jgi:hypothetical protein
VFSLASAAGGARSIKSSEQNSFRDIRDICRDSSASRLALSWLRAFERKMFALSSIFGVVCDGF